MKFDFKFSLFPQPSLQISIRPTPKIHRRRKKKREEAYRLRYDTPDALFIESEEQEHNFRSYWFELFATRQIARFLDREFFIKYTIRQLCLHIMFSVCITTVSLTLKHQHLYTHLLHKSIADLFIKERMELLEYGDNRTINDIGRIEDIWDYLENPFVHNMYWEYFYHFPTKLNANSTGGHDNSEDYNIEKLPENDSRILYSNYLLGRPRLRQLRVKINDCPESLEIVVTNNAKCFPEYNETTEDKKGSWGGGELNVPTSPPEISDAFKYQKLNGSIEYQGHYSLYPVHGYIILLPETKVEAIKMFQELKRLNWLDRSSRVLFLDFAILNPTVNISAFVSIVWELPAAGLIYLTTKITPISLRILNDQNSTWFLSWCQAGIILLLTYYIIQECYEFHVLGFYLYSHNFWCWLDVAIITTTIYSLYGQFGLKSVQEETIQTIQFASQHSFHNYEKIVYWYDYFTKWISICSWLSYLKFFKFIGLNKRMGMLKLALKEAIIGVAWFSVMFFVVFLAFAWIGFLEFGDKLEQFRTLDASILALFRVIAGGFDIDRLETTYTKLGPIYFVSFLFCVLFILFNMYLAIVNDRYRDIHEDVMTSRAVFEISDYFTRVFYNFLSFIRYHRPTEDITIGARVGNTDGLLSYGTIRRNFLMARYSTEDVDAFTIANKLTEDGFLEEDDSDKWLTKLYKKHKALIKARKKPEKINPYKFKPYEFPSHIKQVVYLKFTKEGFADLKQAMHVMEKMFFDCSTDLTATFYDLTEMKIELKKERRQKEIATKLASMSDKDRQNVLKRIKEYEFRLEIEKEVRRQLRVIKHEEKERRDKIKAEKELVNRLAADTQSMHAVQSPKQRLELLKLEKQRRKSLKAKLESEGNLFQEVEKRRQEEQQESLAKAGEKQQQHENQTAGNETRESLQIGKEIRESLQIEKERQESLQTDKEIRESLKSENERRLTLQLQTETDNEKKQSHVVDKEKDNESHPKSILSKESAKNKNKGRKGVRFQL